MVEEVLMTDWLSWVGILDMNWNTVGKAKCSWRIGRRIVELQTSLALLDAPQAEIQQRTKGLPDNYGRLPFQHLSLQNLESVTVHTKERILDRQRIAQLAQHYGLGDVIRWKPRQVRS